MHKNIKNAVIALMCAFSGLAYAAPITFQPTSLDFPNPEHGFYKSTTSDFMQISENDIQSVKSQGYTLMYAPIRLDAYKTTATLPQSFLNNLQNKFNLFRQYGVKVIVRFMYNNPANETEYQNAQDANVSIVTGHISQLKSFLAVNQDVIYVMQAGFIGAWGEWHTSSNNLTSEPNKLSIRNALLDAVPTRKFIQVRTPQTLINWFSSAPSASQAFSTKPIARIGLHNDCFLASQTDVGTFQTTNVNDSGRVYLDTASEIVPFGGETCDATYDVNNVARTSCTDIMQEASRYSLSYLNIDYYSGFINGWQANGCFNNVSRMMGYRFEIQSANHTTSATRGGTFNLDINVRNVGWARLYNQRAFSVILRHKATGNRIVTSARSIDPRKWTPNQTVLSSTSVRIPANSNLGDYDVLISLPDYHSSLQNNPLFNIRFANADDVNNNQAWESARGEFRLGSTLTVN